MEKTDEIRAYCAEHGTITIPELQSALGLDYRTALEAVRQLVSQNILEYGGGISYSYKEPPAPAPEEPQSGDGDGQEENGSDRSGGEEYIPIGERIIERFRRLTGGKHPFFDKDNEENDNSDDEEGDEDEELDDEDDEELDDEDEERLFGDDDEDDYPLPDDPSIILGRVKSPLERALDEFGRVVEVYKQQGEYFLSLFTRDATLPDFRISIEEREGSVWLCDRGEVSWALGNRLAGVTAEQIGAAVDLVIVPYHTVRRGNKLYYKLQEGYAPAAALMVFYAAIRRALDLDERETEALAAGGLSAEFCAVLGDFCTENPAATRAEALEFARQSYEKIKDGECYESIRAHAGAILELNEMSEERFSAAKARLSAKPKSSDGFGENEKGVLMRAIRESGIDVQEVAMEEGGLTVRYRFEAEDVIDQQKLQACERRLPALLHAENGVRLRRTGRTAFSVEVAKPAARRTVLERKDLLKAPRKVCFGREVNGSPMAFTFEGGHDLLVAGDDGGRVDFLRVLFAGMFERYKPADLRILVCGDDAPLLAEIDRAPYRFTEERFERKEGVFGALRLAVEEAERRALRIKAAFEGRTVPPTLERYNRICAKGEKLPLLAVVVQGCYYPNFAIDRWRVTTAVFKLRELSRMTGVHIILSERIPDVFVCGAFDTRVVFRVDSARQSRFILGERGAETLSGDGDMLVGTGKETFRGQLARYRIGPMEAAMRAVLRETEKNDAPARTQPSDRLRIEALKEAVLAGEVTAALLQRNLGVSYLTAISLIEWMDDKGYIGGRRGALPRKVLITKEQFDRLFPPFS